MNTNLMLHGATKLSKSEMKNVKGGIPAEEYCANLYNIYTHNVLEGGALQGFVYGWQRANCSRFYKDITFTEEEITD